MYELVYYNLWCTVLYYLSKLCVLPMNLLNDIRTFCLSVANSKRCTSQPESSSLSSFPVSFFDDSIFAFRRLVWNCFSFSRVCMMQKRKQPFIYMWLKKQITFKIHFHMQYILLLHGLDVHVFSAYVHVFAAPKVLEVVHQRQLLEEDLFWPLSQDPSFLKIVSHVS